MNVVMGVLFAGMVSGGVVQAEEEKEGPPRKEERQKEHRHRGHKGGFEHMLKKLDQDGDKAVSLEEFSASERVSRLPADYQKKLFQRLDKNKDGRITKADIRDHEATEKRRRPSDTDGNGEISFEEFQQSDRFAKMSQERKREIFDKMDRNDDGVLNDADWKRHRERGGPRGSWRFGESLDTDKDGKLSFEEFCKHPRHTEASEEQLKAHFKKIDKNSDGFIDKAERPMGPPKEGGPPSGKRRGERKTPTHPPELDKSKESSSPQCD